MFRFFKGATVLVVLVGTLLSSCRKEEFDKYYGRPDGLGKPIYQQLDSMGDFKNFLVCIDKSGYKNTLGSAASWTVFAPTDEAFKVFLVENNISDINTISDSLATKIVRTSMIYDGEKVEKLKDNFSQAGFIEDVAFRRRTVYYDFVETAATTIPGHTSKKFISTNRTAGQGYFAGDNNNKHISYFFTDYMSQRGLSATDYNAFYPQSNYSGLNIANAEIDPIKHDIIAENGVIHVVNKVLMPEKSIAQYLREKPQYSIFKSILDSFATYTYNEDVSHRYQVLTGNKDSVFTKSYQDILLAVNNENFTKEDANDAQVNNNSITVPTNDALEDYANKVLLKYYPSGTKVLDLFSKNKVILSEFVNSHFYNGQLWPTKFNSTNNIVGESPKVNSANIVETKLLSNGAFYGINKSQQANVFHTVYGNVLLDPKYRLMGLALQKYGYNLTLKIPSIRYMLVLVSDNVLNALGYSYDTYYPGDEIRLNGGSGKNSMIRMMQQHIIPLENYPIPNLSGDKGLLESLNGEYLQYDNGRLASAGTLDSASLSRPTSVKIESTDIGTVGVSGPTNGQVVYVSGALSASTKTIGQRLIDLGANNTNSPYYSFFNYLKNSPDMYKSTGEVTGVDLGVQYTFLIPNNAAIASAITNGILPASATTTDVVQKDLIKYFLKYHIVKNSFAIDGKKTGAYQSLYKDINDNVVVVTIDQNTTSNINLKDAAGRTISTILNDSNQLGDRIVIHSLNSYLDYRKN